MANTFWELQLKHHQTTQDLDLRAIYDAQIQKAIYCSQKLSERGGTQVSRYIIWVNGIATRGTARPAMQAQRNSHFLQAVTAKST